MLSPLNPLRVDDRLQFNTTYKLKVRRLTQPHQRRLFCEQHCSSVLEQTVRARARRQKTHPDRQTDRERERERERDAN